MTRAPSASSRASSSVWVPSAMMSRWTRFFPCLASGTFTKTSRGLVRPGSPTTQKGLLGISCLDHGQPVTALQNWAVDAVSEQSKVTFRMELLMLTPPSRLHCHCASQGVRPELRPDLGQVAAEPCRGRVDITGSADWAWRDGCQSSPLHDPVMRRLTVGSNPQDVLLGGRRA